MPSFLARKGDVKQDWYHVDAKGEVLGRMATRIATVLMGKHKPTYTAHVDTGDFVVVTNAADFKLTGNKHNTMTYASYSYYPGGYKEKKIVHVLDQHPERVVHEAVRRMMPKNAMGRRMMKKLKVYTGDTHPHTAQQPRPLADVKC